MDPKGIRELYNQYGTEHRRVVRQARESERYYRNDTDVKNQVPKGAQTGLDGAGQLMEGENPLRNADNRISHRWHGLMVEQKASYVATYPPLLDLKADKLNSGLLQALGDDWGRDFRHLVVSATNAGVGWLHVWEEDGQRKFGVVDAKQIIPIHSADLRRKLQAVIRRYESRDQAGRKVIVTEYWDDRECTSFVQQSAGGEYTYDDTAFAELDAYTGAVVGSGHTLPHNLGEVPFIEFPNNAVRRPDLQLMYKDLVDLYDRVASGFANDIEDIQQVIFIIQNYGGENLGEFLTDLKRYKAIKVEDSGTGGQGGVSTLAIDIPVEARRALLEELRRDILTFGMGVDPDPDKLGNISGVALRHKYGLLELKCGALEVEFRPGIAKLARLLMPELSGETPILQTWTRNMVQNDLEQAQIVSTLAGLTSQRTLDENNPLVDDANEEEKRREKDETRMLEQSMPPYPPPPEKQEE